MKKLKNRIMSVMIAVAVAFPIISSCTNITTYASDEIKINSINDLIEFSQNCTLDTWSVGKNVVLTQDLNLSGQKFTPIATFGGTFDGCGHNIIGLNIYQSGSNLGLFRYLQENGTIKNLNVTGYVTPQGSKSNIGGIVGNNSGNIISCNFSGTVEGDNSIGGIAGINTESGRIADCSSDAFISGKKSAGGIAGKNLGTILKCSGKGKINTIVRETTVNFDDIDVGSTIDQLKSGNNETDTSIVGHSDSGGIAGYSSGNIQSCKNTGIVGYQHVGYNIGGIVGRQAGYISNCTNSGEIYGRKDVGGIVGQMEPYIIIDLSEDTMKMIKDDLYTLNTMINKAIDDSQSSSTEITTQLDTIISYSDQAKASAQNLSDSTSNFIDDNISEINRTSDVVSGVIDRMVPVFEDAEKISDLTSETAKETNELLDTLQKMSEENSKAVEQGKLALNELDKANVYLSTAFSDIKEAVQHLEMAIVIDDQNAVDAALAELSIGITNLGTALTQESDALSELETALSGINDWSDLTASASQITAAIESLSTATGAMGEASMKIGTAVGTISDNTHLNKNELTTTFDYIKDSMIQFSSSTQYLNAASGYMKTAMEYMDNASEMFDTFFEESDAINKLLEEISNTASSTAEKLKNITQELADTDPVEFVKLGEEYRENGDRLFSSITGIISETDSLNSSAYSSSQILSEDIRNINNQANKISEMIINEVAAITDTEDIFEDTSDIDVAATILGKVSYCHNTGNVNGDRNVGGITGSMAIDYDIDPEDDITGNLSKNATYETKSVMQYCINSGKISAKKDCSGGLVGRMDLGTVITCENYGDAESINGDYVGGIAGICSSNIMISFSKCNLSGRNYVGGIAGSAKKMSECGAIVSISATEQFGAIAGTAEIDSEKIHDNLFLDIGFCGIDGISYTGIAEPTDFEMLGNMKSVPSKFLSFTLRFIADEKSVAEIPFNYNSPLGDIDLPDVPIKEGYYGEWETFDKTGKISDITVNAVYKPWITVIENDDITYKNLPYVVADGRFTDKCKLNFSITDGSLPDNTEIYDVYNVSFDNGGAIEDVYVTSLRLLNVTGSNNITVYGFDGKDWRTLEHTLNGQYIIVSEPNNFGSYIIVPDNNITLYLIIGGSVLLIVVLFTIIIINKKRKKKTVKK